VVGWVLSIGFGAAIAGGLGQWALSKVITALGRDAPPLWARSLTWACTGGMVYGVGLTIRDGGTWQLAVCPAIAIAGWLTAPLTMRLIARTRRAKDSPRHLG
jgi:predicted membrane protein